MLFGFGIGILMIVVIYLIDFTQTCQTIRRNYLVVGRFRYLFEHLGEFFRQYFFTMDREELSFNRSGVVAEPQPVTVEGQSEVSIKRMASSLNSRV